MNEIQNVFAIFFAIFLGTIANVQPRWKAFNWPLLFLMPPGSRALIVRRLVLSVAVLNVAPVVFFGFGLWMLIGNGTDAKDWTGETVRSVVLHGVIPAFAAFAFYRLWLACIEFNPSLFYVLKQENLPQDLQSKCPSLIEPSIDDLKLTSRGSCANFVFGFAYLIVPASFLLRWP